MSASFNFKVNFFKGIYDMMRKFLISVLTCASLLGVASTANAHLVAFGWLDNVNRPGFRGGYLV
jgi:hypothetical protein